VPTYQYVCADCGRDLEAVQSFSDAALTECPTCSGRLRKKYGSIGVVFKGSGFYRNDSRAADPSSSLASNGEKSSEKSGSAEKSSGSEKSDTPASKPAAEKSSGSGSGSSSNGSGSSGSSTSSSSSTSAA
jgi:putative FmdB family regulatory protein